MLSAPQDLGLGDINAQLKVYIANRPNIDQYHHLTGVRQLGAGEITHIGQLCGNGWRKVFNVYAKLVFALNQPSLVELGGASSWQEFRDKRLLQSESNTSLLFSAQGITEPPVNDRNSIHIVMGKTYANTLPLAESLTWLDNEFAINKPANLLVCPYFDYRQLSNIKIIRLVTLIKSLMSCH